MKQEQTIHMLSLGCPKNRVDSEVMLGHMLEEGYRPVDAPEDADVVVVNTCGFIDAAKEESVDAIIEMEGLKKNYISDLYGICFCVKHFLCFWKKKFWTEYYFLICILLTKLLISTHFWSL